MKSAAITSKYKTWLTALLFFPFYFSENINQVRNHTAKQFCISNVSWFKFSERKIQALWVFFEEHPFKNKIHFSKCERWKKQFKVPFLHFLDIEELLSCLFIAFCPSCPHWSIFRLALPPQQLHCTLKNLLPILWMHLNKASDFDH